jgi:hypothetical protein
MLSEPTPLEWLLLRFIDTMPSWANDYKLNRIFMGTDACFSFWQVLRDLVNKGLLQEVDPEAQVKVYQTTIGSRQLLAQAYSTSRIEIYVMAIDTTGRILNYLKGIDERLSEKPPYE